MGKDCRADTAPSTSTTLIDIYTYIVCEQMNKQAKFIRLFVGAVRSLFVR